jgi:hypothetical protein
VQLIVQLKCKECKRIFDENDTYVQCNLLTAAESDDSCTGNPCCPWCGSVKLEECKSEDKIRAILEHIPTPEEIKQSRRCIHYAQTARKNSQNTKGI